MRGRVYDAVEHRIPHCWVVAREVAFHSVLGLEEVLRGQHSLREDQDQVESQTELQLSCVPTIETHLS